MKRLTEYIARMIPQRDREELRHIDESADPLAIKCKWNMLYLSICVMVLLVAELSIGLTLKLGFVPETNVVPTIKFVSLWLMIFFWVRHLILTKKIRDKGGL